MGRLLVFVLLIIGIVAVAKFIGRMVSRRGSENI
jgi:hypothetical protein